MILLWAAVFLAFVHNQLTNTAYLCGEYSVRREGKTTDKAANAIL